MSSAAKKKTDDFEPESLGHLLAVTRERKGATLEEASVYLRIRTNFIEAMEHDKFQDLPGSAYTLAYLKSYARYLGLEPKDVARRFHEETGVIPAQTEPQFYSPKTLKDDWAPRWVIVAGSFALFVIVGISWVAMRSSDYQEDGSLMEPPKSTFSHSVDDAPLLEAVGAPSDDAVKAEAADADVATQPKAGDDASKAESSDTKKPEAEPADAENEASVPDSEKTTEGSEEALPWL